MFVCKKMPVIVAINRYTVYNQAFKTTRNGLVFFWEINEHQNRMSLRCSMAGEQVMRGQGSSYAMWVFTGKGSCGGKGQAK